MPIGASRQAVHLVYHSIHIYDGFRPYHHSHSFGFQISHFNSIFTSVLSFQRYTQSMYLFHILIHVLISYTHSCTHFIYSFMYSFHSYLVNYQNTGNKNRVREQTEAVGSSFLLFYLYPRLGDHHPSLVNTITPLLVDN